MAWPPLRHLAADDVAVSVIVHRYALANRRLARAEAALAACDAAADAAGVCVETLRWASERARVRSFQPLLDQGADEMIRAMELRTFDSETGCRKVSALSPTPPVETLTSPAVGAAK